MRRCAWRAWAPAALALACVTACAPKRAPKPQELAFWVSLPVAAVEPLARAFERENPGIHVNLVQLPWLSGADSLAAAVRTGVPPDLCQLHCSQLPALMASGALSDWSAGVADLRPALRGWDMCMVGDAIYGVPWLVRTQVLYFNKTLFARAGLDSARAPDTYGQLQAAATKIARLHGGVDGYGVPAAGPEGALARLMPFAYGRRGDSLASSPDVPAFEAPLTAATLDVLKSLRGAGLMAGEDSLAGEFTAGRLGMLLAGSDLALRIARDAPTLAYGMALVPRADPDTSLRNSLAGGEALASFNASRRKEDALKLARWFVQPDHAIALAAALGNVQPANVAADTAACYRGRPEQQIMFRQLDTARFLPYFRGRIALEDTLNTLIDDALDGRRTTREVAAMADTFLTKHVGPR
jgi:multiple sugar transport system substrate-binding protein